MHIADVPIPEPKSGEVRVRIHSVGLNPVDYKAADWGHVAWSYPHTLGADGAGIVDKVGPDVKEFKPGDRVYGLFDIAQPGSFAEYAVTSECALARMPAKSSFEEAAAIPVAGWTAYQVFHRKLNLREGQKILIHAGSGGVGSFAIQFARRQGLRVITTCSKDNFSFVRDLGAEFVIDYQNEDVFEKVMEYTDGRGVRLVLDTLGGPGINENFKLLSFGGHFVGLVDVPDISNIPMFEKALSVQMVFLSGAFSLGSSDDKKDLGVIGAEISKLIEDKKVFSTLSEILPFENIPLGLERLATHRVRGKLVAKVAEFM
jgi:NADPH:quinone reductase-like Zn-dependent oxidoreductase